MINGEKWAAGAAAVGALAVICGPMQAQIQSNNTFLQPFLAYTTKTHTTPTLNTESSYNWEACEWTTPIHLQLSQLLKIGPLPVSIGIAPRYYANNLVTGSEWGIRFLVQLIFPK